MQNSQPSLALPITKQAHKYQTSQQNPFFRSSVSFHSTCFPKAQVCRSIILKLISSLMEVSTNQSKIFSLRTHTTLLQSPALLLATLAEHSLFLVISFFRALKTHLFTLSYLHNFPALLFLPAPFPTGQFEPVFVTD